MKNNILMILIAIAGLYLICFILHILELLLMKVHPVILIIAFCYLIYKILTKEEFIC